MLTPVVEYQLFGIPEDEEESVGDTPKVKVNIPRQIWDQQATADGPEVLGKPIGTTLQLKPILDQASSAGQMNNPEKKKELAAKLAGELVSLHRLIPDTSIFGTGWDEPGSSNTLAQKSLGDSPANMRVIRACYVPPMIPIRIGDVTFPKVLVDTGFGVNVMSNKIHVKLGYHRMAPPTTKLAMADNTLVWPIGVLTSILMVQLVDWAFTGGFTDEDEDQFLDDQPWVIPVVKINLVPLMDKEKQNELKKYLKSIKRKMKLGAPPQIPTYLKMAMNFREDRFGVLGTSGR
ncbi:hypothetical protein R1flu_027649 [Riccia fluitans]|uniref:Uncharacterized protein n=1 Tax=Riccia fluitans TaxID=41844 RepID=A0ABD1XM92_9MARC